MIRHWLCLMILLITFSCSHHEPVSGGVDAGTNFVQGKLLLPNSLLPAVGAKVYLLRKNIAATLQKFSAQTIDSAWIRMDSLRTDSNGIFQFSLENNDSIRIESYVGDSLLILLDTLWKGDDPIIFPSKSLDIPYRNQVVLDNFNEKAGSSIQYWFKDATGWWAELTGSEQLTTSPWNLISTLDSAIE